jgi:hypothetical protein
VCSLCPAVFTHAATGGCILMHSSTAPIVDDSMTDAAAVNEPTLPSISQLPAHILSQIGKTIVVRRV